MGWGASPSWVQEVTSKKRNPARTRFIPKMEMLWTRPAELINVLKWL